jgi:hypothetical protein
MWRLARQSSSALLIGFIRWTKYGTLFSTLRCEKLNKLQLQVVESFNPKESEAPFRELKSDLTNVVKECRALRKSIKSHRAVTLDDPVPDLRSTIPPQPVCEELVQCYLRTFEPIYRVLHVPSFWESYRIFWTEPQSSPMSFLMKLVLILAIGTAFYPDHTSALDNRFTRLKPKWVYAAQWWLTGPSEETTATETIEHRTEWKELTSINYDLHFAT